MFLFGVTVRHGKVEWPESGGGIRNTGVLDIGSSVIRANFAGSVGGGIGNSGSLTLFSSTVSGNTAGQSGGGISNLNAGPSVSVFESTISGNISTSGGGGGIWSGGELTIENSTITANSSSQSGGGIWRTDGTATVVNTIIAANGQGDCFGTIVSLGHNLDGDSTCGLTGVGDLSGVDPLLGPLQDNGGPTFTHALLAGSPAIDAGDDSFAISTDQRGFPRPQGLATDIGAYESPFTAAGAAAATPTPTPQPFQVSFVTKWGNQGSGNGQFQHPEHIGVDLNGNIYLTDRNNHRVQRFTSNSTPPAFLAQWGHENAKGIAVDAEGNLYVLGTPAGFKVTKFSPDGTVLGEWGESGQGDGQFWQPSDITMDATGNIYVADTFNHRVQKFSSNGTFLGKWGSEGTGDGQFKFPTGIAVDAVGNVFVVDMNSYRVQRFDSNGSFVGKWGSKGTGPGQFDLPYGVAVGSSGKVFVTDRSNHRVQVFDVNGSFIGEWGTQGSANGELFNPEGLAVDDKGRIYVVDSENNRIQVFAQK